LGERPEQEHPNRSCPVEADARIIRFELLGEPGDPLEQFGFKPESNEHGFVGHAATEAQLLDSSGTIELGNILDIINREFGARFSSARFLWVLTAARAQ